MRVSKKDYESQRSKMFGPMDQWHHVDCFVSIRSELGFSVEHMPERYYSCLSVLLFLLFMVGLGTVSL